MLASVARKMQKLQIELLNGKVRSELDRLASEPINNRRPETYAC